MYDFNNKFIVMNRNPKILCDELQEDHYKALIESNDIYKNLLHKEFQNFKNFKNKIRSSLINQNIAFRNRIKDINYSKNSTKNNDNFYSKLNQENLKKKNTLSKNDLDKSKVEISNLNFNNCFEIDLNKNDLIDIPKGIFYYPIKRVLRADDIHIVNFIPHFSNFEKFQNVIEKTYFYLDDWFDEIPHNLDFDEKIHNPEFIIWIFFEGLKNLSKQVEEFTQSYFVNILTIFSSIIEKNSSTVFKIYQMFLRKIINEKQIKKRIDFCKSEFTSIKCLNNKLLENQLNDNPDFYETIDNSDYKLYKKQYMFKNEYLDINFNIKNDYFKREGLLLSNKIEELLQEFILARTESISSFNKNYLDYEKNLIKDNNFDFDNINETSNTKHYKKNKKYHNNKFFYKYQESDKNKTNFSVYGKKKKKKNTSEFKMNFYRNAYCQICFLYYCPYHFKRDYKFYDYEFNNITLHKRYLKRLIIEPQPRNGLEFLEKFKIFNFDFPLNKSPKKIKIENLLENFNTNIKINQFDIECENKENKDNSHFDYFKINDKSHKITVEKERKNTKFYKIDSLSPKKLNPNHNNFTRAKQIIQAYKLNINNYNPCTKHDGPCTNENCECIKYRSACEKFCACSGNCKNEYPGCPCYKRCESDCPCVTNMRECDPDICKCCSEILFKKNDSINDDDKIIDNLIKLNNLSEINKFIKNKNYIQKENIYDCGNCSIFLGNVKKTYVSKSLIASNYGLFTMKDIKKNEFICEYIGELLSKEETDRRSVFNDQLGLNYFFKLNECFDIDAYAIGNEMRFVNHSSYGYDNCFARTKYVRGVYRIGLFAMRNISKGEELFFDYKINWNVPWMNNYKKLFSFNQ